MIYITTALVLMFTGIFFFDKDFLKNFFVKWINLYDTSELLKNLNTPVESIDPQGYVSLILKKDTNIKNPFNDLKFILAEELTKSLENSVNEYFEQKARNKKNLDILVEKANEKFLTEPRSFIEYLTIFFVLYICSLYLIQKSYQIRKYYNEFKESRK